MKHKVICFVGQSFLHVFGRGFKKLTFRQPDIDSLEFWLKELTLLIIGSKQWTQESAV